MIAAGLLLEWAFGIQSFARMEISYYWHGYLDRFIQWQGNIDVCDK